MNRPFRMHPVECFHNRDQNAICRIDRNPSTRMLNKLPECLSLYVFHGKIRCTIFLEAVLYLYNVFISDKLCKGVCFVQELFFSVYERFLHISRKNLDCFLSGNPCCKFNREEFLDGNTGFGIAFQCDIRDTESTLPQNMAYDIPFCQCAPGRQSKRILLRILCFIMTAVWADNLVIFIMKTVIADICHGFLPLFPWILSQFALT